MSLRIVCDILWKQGRFIQISKRCMSSSDKRQDMTFFDEDQNIMLNNNVDFVPVTHSEAKHQSLIIKPPDQPLNPKILKVSVLGMPNAGKSTFINAILGNKLMATSCKIDTTIENILAIRTVGDTQILFQDTPGIMSNRKAGRHKLARDRVSLPSNSFFDADIGIILADLTSLRVKDGFLQPEILLTMIKNRHVPTVLVLNKVDKYPKKDHLLPLIYMLTAGRVGGEPFEPEKLKLVPMRLPKIKNTVLTEYENLDLADETALEKWMGGSEHRLLNKLRFCRGWPHFEDVFVISAKEGEGLNAIKNYMLNHAKFGAWKYHSEVKTDASPKQIILDSVRAGLLQYLPQEIPYRVLPRITEWGELEDGRLYVEIEILCGRQSHYNIVERKSHRIAIDTQEHLQDVFFMETFVEILPIFFKNMGV